MTATPVHNKRTPRSFWVDPRFTIGIVLVIASIGAVWVVVSSADTSTAVFAARSVLTVGDRITADDLVEQSVRLGTATDKYVGVATIPAEGLVVTRSVAAGELVPASAVGNTAGERLAPVVISVVNGLPRDVVAGATVDVWASKVGDGGAFGPPTVLVPSATVVRVIESEGIVASAQAVSVELLIPRARTARILEALSNSDSLSLIPANLPATLAKG